jgi:hypothetical protein
MKVKGKNGGYRPGAGPKVDVFHSMALHAAALQLGVSIDRIRQLLREDWGGRVELLLSAKKIRKLKRLSELPEAKEYLSGLKYLYSEHRRKWGYIS